MKRVFSSLDLQICGLKLNKCGSNFHPLEAVGRVSETQLQVGENLYCIYYISLLGRDPVFTFFCFLYPVCYNQTSVEEVPIVITTPKSKKLVLTIAGIFTFAGLFMK